MSKLLSLVTAGLVILLSSCSAQNPNENNNNMFNGFYEGPFYTISHPKGYAVEPVGTTVTIRRDKEFAVQVASQPNPNVKLGDLATIEQFVNIVRSSVSSIPENQFAIKEMAFSGKTGYFIESSNSKTGKGGVMCTIPLDGGLVIATSEQEVNLGDEFEMAKNMVISIVVTHDDFFSNPFAYQSDDSKPGNFKRALLAQYFEVKELEGWTGTVDGPGKLVLEKDNADKFITFLAINRAELGKDKYIDEISKSARSNNLNIVNGKVTYADLEFDMLLFKYENTQTESVNLVREDGSMTYIIKIFGDMTPAVEKMIGSFVIK
jgi:hypothetical protein